MAKSISNDAIWEKLSEMDEKYNKILDKINKIQLLSSNTTSSTQPSSDNEVITEIKERVDLLGRSNDSHFKANSKNIEMINNNILVTKKKVENIQIPENLNINEIKALFENKNVFRFGFIKFRKSSFVIVILGLLIFALTMFCMKQQNDYSILNSELYKQMIATQNLQIENDSLKVKAIAPSISKTKKKR